MPVTIQKLRNNKLFKGIAHHKPTAWLLFWGLLISTSIYFTIPHSTNTPITESLFSLTTKNISSDNKWSRFQFEKNGIFYSHPGEKEPVSGTLSIKESKRLKIELSIRDGSKAGNILFIINHNNKQIAKTEVKVGDAPFTLTQKVKKGDELEIIADKNGRTSQDWGNIRITESSYLDTLGYLFLYLVWGALLFFFWKKNQASTAIAFFGVFIIAALAERHTFGEIKQDTALAYLFLSITLAFISSFLYQETFKLRKSWLAATTCIILAFLAYSLPTIFLSYILIFESPVQQESINAVLQSNTSESREFLFDYLNIKALLFVTLVISAISYAFWWHRKSSILILDRSLFSLLITLSALALYISSEHLRLPHFVSNAIDEYHAELQQFRKIQEKRKDNTHSVVASKKAEGETYVIVIGESLNKNHMSLYGYHRTTTPELDALYNQKQILRFDNIYSNHTHTMPVLSLALTEAAQDNQKNYYESISIIEILNSANFETFWLTNQNLLGAWDNLVSAVAAESDKIYSINSSIGRSTRTQRHDGDLLPIFERVIAQKTKKNRAIFVHLMGNHGSYCLRYPDTFKKFTGELSDADFGKQINKKHSNSINCYDNSVLYNDFVVSSLIKTLQNAEGATSLLYFSDHGDDVINAKGHNSSNFSYEMTHVPMIVWFSEKYKQRYPEKIEALYNNKTKLFTNDRIYDLIIGWAQIETPHQTSKFDISLPTYHLEASNALTLHGKKRISDPGHIKYWQSENTKHVLASELRSKVLPHRINSTGKLSDIWHNGFRSLEVDILYDYKGDGKFYVGHNDGVMGTDLGSFLSSIPYNEIEKIWLDFKNLNERNHQAALDELEKIDRLHDLKGKAILESGWRSSQFSIFRKAGWRTSYYLPTGKLKNALKENNPKILEALAIEISEQVTSQRISSVSFDLSLYPFVKNNLEKRLDAQIDYHGWLGPTLRSPNFLESYNSSAYAHDERLKTVLVAYKSDYDL